jgi:hypothetical protein
MSSRDEVIEKQTAIDSFRLLASIAIFSFFLAASFKLWEWPLTPLGFSCILAFVLMFFSTLMALRTKNCYYITICQKIFFVLGWAWSACFLVMAVGFLLIFNTVYDDNLGAPMEWLVVGTNVVLETRVYGFILFAVISLLASTAAFFSGRVLRSVWANPLIRKISGS